jgi:hypothetical protein
MITAPELMLTVVRTPAGFHIIDVLLNVMKFCSAYHLSHIMDSLFAALQPNQQRQFRKLVIHADNSRVHT